MALAVRGLSKAGRFQNVSFEARGGEILGIAGLMGAGRTDVVSAIFGLSPAESGEIWIDGRRVKIASPRDAIRNGIAMVSEDRKEFGLVLKMSVKHNLTLSNLAGFCRWGFIDRAQESEVVEDQIQRFSIRTPHQNQETKYLSGGNQQKVVIAKALLTKPKILILDEPTRGIDIAAKTEVYEIMSRLARGGRAIIMVSSELPEILALSDRILVMREGRITAELDAREATQEELLKYAIPA